MDKYTVDLDQVLNDFEYNELTTEQPKFNRNTPNASNSYYSAKNSSQKHSINNVFHSLNEYLNSDISVKTPPVLSATTTTTPPDTPAISISKPPIVPQTSANNYSLIDTPCLEKPLNDNNASTISNNLVKNINEESRNNKKTDFVVVEEKLINLDIKQENVFVDNFKIEENEEEEGADEEKGVLEIEESEEKFEDCVDNTKENVAIKQESVEETKKEDNPAKEEIEEQATKDEQEEEKLLEESAEDLSSGVKLVEEMKEEVATLVRTKKEKKVEDVKAVGFDDSIESDDSELNNYLEELEKEYDSQQVEKIEEPEEKPQEEDKQEEIKRPDNLPLPQESQENNTESRKINLIGDPGSTPYNNVYITKELPQNKKENPTSDTECSTSASPTFSDISSQSTETTSSLTPSNDTAEQQTVVPDNELGTPELAPSSPNILSPPAASSSQSDESTAWLGTLAPLWIPDSDAINCLHCNIKFTVLKRRHHCRACGLVLCSKCCNLRLHLEYLMGEARVCNKCYEILTTDSPSQSENESNDTAQKFNKPNPNNPLEYCSTVPPHQQVASGANNTPPAVMVPVGVLKRKGSKGRSNKSVMFCDGIRPGSDLTNLDNDFSYTDLEKSKNNPVLNHETKSFIPDNDKLPPVVKIVKNDLSFSEVENDASLSQKLKEESVIFALQLNLLIHVKIIDMGCCINKTAWCFTTEGLINVGQDEIIILLELQEDELLPKDIFLHLNSIYLDAVKGVTVKEMGVSLHSTSNFLNSKNHAGFVYIKPSFQCMQNVIKPSEPFLIGILIHRWETPWAKLFPLRLVLRLGAEYRYYPSPIISTRFRDSCYVEIGHTIINLLADFRNFSYSLPQIRGLTIHMEEKNTTLTIPINRYDQVMKSLNNSSDHILAFAGNFSNLADSHLVCIQDTQSNENSYSTHAINIQNKPRKVTGASFIVFNGALKSSSGLTAKSSIVEDGLMVQIPAEHMTQIRESLRNMKNHTIQCGCINAASDETVNIIWGEVDGNFNIGVESPIDGQAMNGVPSIRVHNGKDFVSHSGSRLIRWTEVFIIQNSDESPRNHEPVDVSKVSESIAKATCNALVKYLDLLVSNNFNKIGIRTTLHVENVSYSAGSNNVKLPPIYMKSLDNELIPVLHRITSNNFSESAIVLELIFRILNK